LDVSDHHPLRCPCPRRPSRLSRAPLHPHVIPPPINVSLY
jgi:hypothetical protein